MTGCRCAIEAAALGVALELVRDYLAGEPVPLVDVLVADHAAAQLDPNGVSPLHPGVLDELVIAL